MRPTMIKRLLIFCGAIVFLVTSFDAHGQTQLIVNGGFETGDGTGWILDGTEVANNYPHTGLYTLWFGGLTTWADNSYQTVTVPSSISSATLSFYYNIVSQDTSGSPNDLFTATIQDSNGTDLATVGSWSNADSDQGAGGSSYHQKTFNLFPYRGQTIRVAFASTNNATLLTSFFLDDVSVLTTAVSGPADLTPQNVSVSPTPALAGGTVSVTYNVVNVGGAAAPASHTKVVIKDPSNNIFAQQVFATAALASGAATNESHVLGLVGATTGSYNVFVTVDSNSEVSQTNTSNDISSVPLTVQAPAGLVITPIFDSSITSDPNSATIQQTINAAIQQYEAAFSDPITVTIQFSKMASGLGHSSTYINNIAYSTLLTALNSDAKTTNDAIALAHLPAGPNNPVNGNSSVTLTLPNLRALGLSGAPPAGQPDSTISLNLSVMNLSRSSIDPSKYDLMAVAQHEIDEALGFGSALNGLANGAPAPTGPVGVIDLFRYDQNGARSLNTSSSAQAYFSLDGVTDLVRFNQSQSGDYQDFYSPGGQTPRVQDAFGTHGATPNLGVELIGLDALGYNLVSAIPVPQIISNAKTGNTIALTWTSQANLNYQLQYKTNVAQVGGLNLGGAIKANGPTTSTSDTIAATQRYYRIAVATASSSIVSKVASEPALRMATSSMQP
ncbi:MAG: hypothetical protein JWO95_932 [Verrucomicrobiales bacterium]|nr:hypothetical protein [Verrucomicrobiales bacterium]